MNSGLPVSPLEEQQRRDAPVARVVPAHLRRHHLRVAHHRVLAVVQPDERIEQAQIRRVERLGARRDVLASRVADDEVGHGVVAHRDEIRAGRVEGIREDAGFSDHRPALR